MFGAPMKVSVQRVRVDAYASSLSDSSPECWQDRTVLRGQDATCHAMPTVARPGSRLPPASALSSMRRPFCTLKVQSLRRNRVGLIAHAVAAPEAPPKAITGQEAMPQVCVVLGTQWGDEGKGKLVDILARQYDIVARAQGGANAGHTIYNDKGEKFALHLVPSGILHEGAICVVGNGVVVHLPSLLEEIEALEARGVRTQGRLLLSDRAQLLFDLHKEVDGAREAELAGGKIGTTKRGIGPAYASKATRNGLRVGDLRYPDMFADKLRRLAEDAKKRFPDLPYDLEADILKYKDIAARVLPFVGDSVDYINTAWEQGRKILIEGANATMLDIDFGTYPFVTSSNPSIGGVASGLGLAPSKFQEIIGVAKAYTTRVGSGPYPTEIEGALAEELRGIGAEYGTTTGRPRRIGWLDIPTLKFATRINGLTALNLTKLDVLSNLDTIPLGVAYRRNGQLLESVPADIPGLEELEVIYEELPGWKSDISKVRVWEDLPEKARQYIARVEELVGVRCRWIGVGPGRDAIVEQPSSSPALLAQR